MTVVALITAHNRPLPDGHVAIDEAVLEARKLVEELRGQGDDGLTERIELGVSDRLIGRKRVAGQYGKVGHG